MHRSKREMAQYIVEAHGTAYTSRNREMALALGFRSWTQLLAYAGPNVSPFNVEPVRS